MSSKSGHKLKSVAALSIQTSKKVHGEPNQINTDDQEKIKTDPEILSENVTKLLVANPLTEKIVFGNDLLSDLYRDVYSMLTFEKFKTITCPRNCLVGQLIKITKKLKCP